MHVTKINVFFNIFYCRDDSDNFIVIVRIEKFYFCNILSIRVDALCNLCKIIQINKVDRSRSNANIVDKILKSILLLLKKVDILLRNIRHNNRRQSRHRFASRIPFCKRIARSEFFLKEDRFLYKRKNEFTNKIKILKKVALVRRSFRSKRYVN